MEESELLVKMERILKKMLRKDSWIKYRTIVTIHYFQIDADSDNQKDIFYNNWVHDGDNDDESNTKVLHAEEQKMKDLKLKMIDRHEDVQVKQHKRYSISRLI